MTNLVAAALALGLTTTVAKVAVLAALAKLLTVAVAAAAKKEAGLPARVS